MGWAVVVVALVVATLVIGWLFGVGSGPGPVTAATSPTPTPTTAPTVRPSLSPTATARPSAIDTPEPTSAPTVEPTAAPAIEPTPAPTVEPTVEPSPEPTIDPSVPTGLAIAFPADGEYLSTRVINVFGTAPPGSTITRDVPLWFDDHVTTRNDGIWMMSVQLGDGSNQLSFRIGDDQSTEIHLTVVYESPG